MRRVIVFCVMLAILPTHFVFGQSDSSIDLPGAWTLQSCLDYAIKYNIQLNTLRLSQQSNWQTLQEAKAARFPSLSGSIAQTVTHSDNANPVVGGFATQSTFSDSYGLTSAWTVYNGGYINNNIRLQKLNLEAAKLNTQVNANSLVISITVDYLAVLDDRETIIYTQEILTTSQAQLDQGKQQFAAGSIARNALAELDAQTAADQYNLVLAENNYRRDVLALKQLLQLPSGYVMNVVSPDTVEGTLALVPLSQAQTEAYNSRPEVRNAQISIQSAQTTVRLAKAQMFPVVSLGGSMTSGYSNNVPVKYGTQINDNFYQRLGLAINIPIFNNRIYRTQAEIAKVQVEQAKLSLTGTATTLSQEVEQAYINALNAQAENAAALRQLDASRESYRAASEQFKAGSTSLVDLLQQKSLYVQAFQAYIQAKYAVDLDVSIYNFYRGEKMKL